MVSETKVVPAFLGGFICIYGLVSGFVKERLFLSESLVAMVFGIIIGPRVINIVDPHSFLNVERFTLEFARYVIAIQVMAAGITLPGRYIVRKWRTMSIMLGPVMIVMWLVTAGIIHLLFDLEFTQSLLIASCAAPTDPILANSVVKGRYAEANVPKNVRDALSAESGINDGLGLPFLYFALYLLNESYSTRHAIGKWFYWIWCYNILLSVAIGIVIGYVARKLLRLAESYDLIDKESFLAFSIGLSVFIVGILQLIRSDDVLCCFIAGHSFTWDDWFREETKDAHFQEVLDGLINVSFFVYLGTIIPWDQFNNAELVISPWRLIVAAIMVLLLRRLPVVVLLTRITPAFRNYRQSIFAGWFGPIGVGAAFFMEIVLEEIEADPDNYHLRSREIIQPIVIFLIFSSVLVHGVTLPLLYIGKVVRSRSRSFSTMSIRNGIASRLSFVNSREPPGVHGVQIPMMDSSLSDEFVETPHGKRDSRLMFSTSQPDSAETSRSSPFEGEKPDGSAQQPAAPLDLARTITIDETPKIARDQMDIHYRVPQSHLQYRQYVQNLQMPPSAIHGPGYSHLHPEVPMRSFSSQELSEPLDIQTEAAGQLPAAGPSAAAEVPVEPPRAVRVRSRERPYSGASDTHSDTDVAALQHEIQRRSLEEPHHAGQLSGDHSPEPEGLSLAADEEIESRRASRAETRQTVASNPEAGDHQLPDLEISPISRRSSLPVAAASHVSTPASAAHPYERTQEMHHHALDLGSIHRGPGHSRGDSSGFRRVLRRRRRQQQQQPADDVDAIGGPACEFIGNRRNPLGRLEDGELVDYDDPADDDLEVSFMENNVDDRFIDYLTVDLGSGIRRLKSILPAISRRQTDHGSDNA
ncbi:hypothetical protein H4S02_004033 [Coemansia sp. RSA 2611]|nr:hypothetical protein H4S02_004033 [Coemansia sp. RSA 2611]